MELTSEYLEILDSKCIASICLCCAECANGPNSVMWTQMELVKTYKSALSSLLVVGFFYWNYLWLYEYNISITQKQTVNTSTATK